jgi:N-acetylneuraminic acid mutarotase
VGLSSVYAWDPKTDAWTPRADMPTARAGLSVAVVDGVLYAVGGGTPDAVSPNVEAYDPQTDSWSTRQRLSKARVYLSTCVVDGILYAIGGASSPYFTGYLADVDAYDPKTDQWTKKKPMPRAGAVVAAVVDGMIYALGGTQVFAYDPKTDTWITKVSSTPARYLSGVCVADGSIYHIGGFSPAGDKFYSSVSVYDPIADVLAGKRSFPGASAGSCCAVVDGRIYVMGGRSSVASPTIYDAVYEFSPTAGISSRITTCGLSSAGKLQLTWDAEPGIQYAVEARDGVSQGQWLRQTLPVGNTVIASDNQVETELSRPDGASQRFYRIVEVN